MVFLQVGVLKTLYTFILKNRKKYKKYLSHKNLLKEIKRSAKLSKSIIVVKKSKETKNLTVYELVQEDQEKPKVIKLKKNQKDYLHMAWATVYIAIALLVIIIRRDIDSELADSDSTSAHDYKDLYIGVYSTWLVGLLIAIYFPKCASFPVPIITAAFDKLNMKKTKLFHALTFIVQSLMIWILFCLIQLLTLHGVFWLVALLAKPVGVLVTLAYMFALIALAISSTSIMLEALSLERINPYWRKYNKNSERFWLYNYLKDLPNLIAPVLLSIFILALLFLHYQFGDKLGSTLDLS